MMGEPKTFVCPHHGTTVEIDSDGCPPCIAHYQAPPDAEAMTPDERVAEMRDWCGGPLTARFTFVHKRIEQLIGRPVWTHEIVLNWEELVEEAGHRRHPTMADIVDLMVKTGKPMIVLVVDS